MQTCVLFLWTKLFAGRMSRKLLTWELEKLILLNGWQVANQSLAPDKNGVSQPLRGKNESSSVLPCYQY